MHDFCYDAAGNLAQKNVYGKITRYVYDAANQLVSQTSNYGTVNAATKEFAYDGAGRMIREGSREYRYGGFDKVVSVADDGQTVAEFAYAANGQLAEITRKNGNNEKLFWDGLALIRRDRNGQKEYYLNEPHAAGGNPVLA